MKIVHLISGGDTGGAKTHVFSLLQGLKETEDAVLVCFRDGPFAEEARSLGIPTEIIARRGILRALGALRRFRPRSTGCDNRPLPRRARQSDGCFAQTLAASAHGHHRHSDYRLDYMGRPPPRGYLRRDHIPPRCVFWYYRIGVSDAMRIS